MLEEHDLIAGCKREETGARKELYERYAATMLSLCMRYIGDRDIARDVLQDGFYQVFTKIGEYSGTGSFEGWMKRIFINTAIRQLQKKRFLPMISEYEDSIEDTGTSAFEKLSTDDLHHCIAELPDGFRTVFNLYAVEGYSHTEIAKMFHIKEVTSRSQYMHARRILQKKVQQFILQEDARKYRPV